MDTWYSYKFETIRPSCLQKYMDSCHWKVMVDTIGFPLFLKCLDQTSAKCL